jgi:hypothetical protein
LVAQRKVEDERKAAAEKELSLKEVHIKHLENKVKDLSRPSLADSEVKAKEREMERLKSEVLRLADVQKQAEEKEQALSAANNQNALLTERLRAQEEELSRLRT